MDDKSHLNKPGSSGGQNSSKVTKETPFCICCLSINVPLVSLENCKHVEFFERYFEFQFKYSACLVCCACHGTLLDFYEFKRQVQNSLCNLNKQFTKEQLNVMKLSKLTQSVVEIYNTAKSVDCESELDNDITDTDTEIKTEVIKIEPSPEYIKNEDDVPLSEIEVKHPIVVPSTPLFGPKQKPIEKLKVVTLSAADLWQERKVEAAKEKYLKMPFKCVSCIVGLEDEQSLKEHMEKKHTKTAGGFTCDICKLVLSTVRSYEGHMRRHYRRVDCGVCGLRFTNTVAAQAHYGETHATDPPIYKCEKDCGFTTSSYNRLRYHKYSHSDKVTCDQCDKTFANNAGLKTHIAVIHQPSTESYSCAECSKTYRQRAGLRAHARSAHGARDAAYCAACRMHFRNPYILKSHLKTHKIHVNEADKKHVCAVCDARFLKQHQLKEHVEWKHFKNTKHKCEDCNKFFINNAKLKRHINYVHEKIRPPRNKICDHCGRGFTTMAILRSHIRTHTGERPHKCAHCPATFGHSAALYTHNKLLHKEKTKTSVSEETI